MIRNTRILSVCLALILILSACKKKTDTSTGCNSGGGFYLPDHYMWWIKSDLGCGYITVTVTRDNGSTVGTDYPVTKMFDPTTPPACNTAAYVNHATFELFRGQAYTWKAVCGSRQWTGTILVPCEEDQCRLIQLQ